MKQFNAAALIAAPTIVLDPTTPTREALRQMKEARTGHALIAEKGSLSGIFTERDVLLKVIDSERALDQPASSWMAVKPIRLDKDTVVHKVIQHMHDGVFRTVPIVDNRDRIVGGIRHRDIIRYLVAHMSDHVLNRPPDPDQVAKRPEGG